MVALNILYVCMPAYFGRHLRGPFGLTPSYMYFGRLACIIFTFWCKSRSVKSFCLSLFSSRSHDVYFDLSFGSVVASHIHLHVISMSFIHFHQPIEDSSILCEYLLVHDLHCNIVIMLSVSSYFMLSFFHQIS